MMLRHIARIATFTAAVAVVGLCGCNSILNGWLSPIELGAFGRETTLEIRQSLSIEDAPDGVRNATEPTQADRAPTFEEYRLVPGDVVNVFVFELRQRGADSAQQATVDNRGMINLPVLGWVKAAHFTAQELEEYIKGILDERDIIHNAQVLVEFGAQRGLTYTIFGNETLAVRLNRGPGVFPIPRPDFSLIEALSVAGGLAQLVTEIYVFRDVERDEAEARALRNLKGLGDEDAPDTSKMEEIPPVLPSYMMSSAVTPSHAVASLTGATLAQIEPTEREAPVPPPSRNDPGETDVQEIIDLMLSGDENAPPIANEQPGETHHQTMENDPPADPDSGVQTPQPIPAEIAEPNDGGRPTNWIFLNDEWIEVSPESAAPAPLPPLAGGDDDDVAPAIDWEELADHRSEVRLIRISAEGLRQGDQRYNIVIRAGDVIRLFSGDIGFYYMTGHTRRPGVYTFRSGATITLKTAVAAAGGLGPLGWPERVTVYRRVGDREQMLQVNLDRIYAGVEPDFFLKKDDIINIGTHPIAPFLIQIRNFTIPQMNGSITYFYRWVRQETFFRNENLDAPSQPGLFP